MTLQEPIRRSRNFCCHMIGTTLERIKKNIGKKLSDDPTFFHPNYCYQDFSRLATCIHPMILLQVLRFFLMMSQEVKYDTI